jgi:hypothetical protein
MSARLFTFWLASLALCLIANLTFSETPPGKLHANLMFYFLFATLVPHVIWLPLFAYIRSSLFRFAMSFIQFVLSTICFVAAMNDLENIAQARISASGIALYVTGIVRYILLFFSLLVRISSVRNE